MKMYIGVACVVVGVVALGFILWAPYAKAPGEPVEQTPPQAVTLMVAIDERADALGVGIRVLEVLEDSRCPAEVQCIQAGTVRLATTLYTGSGSGSAPQEFMLRQPITTETREVELVGVRPAPTAGETIASGEYEFVFEVRARNL